ncbi:hypothetical protein DFJ58DRAFT_9779 [Suillus subalutaceus]|uniref:uncharacterized protein n=1 Tax=Suillus subalutaceus TaxID=48586 RepID=UPI001B8692D7|nr:uncharacterized protein DFJ58DRAFT_9779 [Suillus subalutaceus]KAG1877875.1 hypothetical protein DFJ58DRAFT_9779 [Suillus subalutaceus]
MAVQFDALRRAALRSVFFLHACAQVDLNRDSCKRRPRRRGVGGTSWRRTPMPMFVCQLRQNTRVHYTSVLGPTKELVVGFDVASHFTPGKSISLWAYGLRYLHRGV